MVIVEYCRFGNIRNILRKHRQTFVNQINRTDDVIDPNVTNEMVTNEGDRQDSDESEVSADEHDGRMANNYKDISEGDFEHLFLPYFQ